jgi:hypothetical protein
MVFSQICHAHSIHLYSSTALTTNIKTMYCSLQIIGVSAHKISFAELFMENRIFCRGKEDIKIIVSHLLYQM